ncbi:MAG: amidase [Armatimonadetes bacterium]|nr:amidase [Armatimonadota bacterium]MBX3110023.1 amidase [Fimbriimonadaceae bacterium]
MPEFSRSEFLKLAGVGLAGMAVPFPALGDSVQSQAASGKATEEQIKTALKLANLSFNDDEVKEMVDSVNSFGEWWPPLREATSDAGFMGMAYRIYGGPPAGMRPPQTTIYAVPRTVKRPQKDEDLAFMEIGDLTALIRSKQVTSTDLTKLYLARLKTYGPKLKCVVTLTEERALAKAAEIDKLIAEGRILGPLAGIPFGVKDLFDAQGTPSTWGIRTRRDHVATEDSDVVKLLDQAGAVLVAKLSLGALAMGDVWFEGRTESPWDKNIGSSGSSAGSGSAVAAGLVAFAIGTETNGSIVSPSHNCRVTGLRPSFGSISRAGAMALCWSLDKVGPICRTAEDCATVFAALCRNMGTDPSNIERDFIYRQTSKLDEFKWGYMVFREEDLEKPLDDANRPWLKVLREAGVDPTPFYMPEYPEAINAILFAECSAAFEEFTRSADIQDLESYSSWPETFRSGRLIPAVEYIQADRFRPILRDIYLEVLSPFEIVIADDRLYPRLIGLNATGIPQTLIPAGVDARGRARSFSLVSKPFEEGKMLAAAQALQNKLGFHKLRPDMSIWA